MWCKLNMQQHPGRLLSLKAFAIVTLATLACSLGLGGQQIPKRIVFLTRLPTFTPTPLATFPTDLTSNEGLPDPFATTPAENDTSLNPTTPPQPIQKSSAVAEPVATVIPTPVVKNDAQVSEEAAPSLESAVASVPAQAAPVDPQATTALANPLPAATPATEEIAESTVPPTILSPAGWEFTNVQIYPASDVGGLQLYGDVTNQTGAPQELDFIAGIVSDAQGQTLAGEDSMIDQWPLDIMPPGAQMPFGLTIDGIQTGANFALNVNAEPIDETPRQDFEFLNVNPANKDAQYCITGSLQNLGNQLQSYLMVVVVLYNDQNNVAGFDVIYEYSPQGVLGDQTLDFEVCADPHNQSVANYDLRAWGS